jgi:hypothetical protein
MGTGRFKNCTEKPGRCVYLGMEESDVFVHGLTKPIRSRQSIISSDEVEYRVRSEISERRKGSNSNSERPKSTADSRIHDLNYERVEEDIIIEVLGIL